MGVDRFVFNLTRTGFERSLTRFIVEGTFSIGLNRPAVSFVFEAVPIQGDRNDPLPSRFSSRIIPAEIRARFAREFHERACNYWLDYIANVKVKRRELVSSSP